MDPGGCRDGPFGSGSVSVVGGEGRNWEREGGFQAAGGAWSRGGGPGKDRTMGGIFQGRGGGCGENFQPACCRTEGRKGRGVPDDPSGSQAFGNRKPEADSIFRKPGDPSDIFSIPDREKPGNGRFLYSAFDNYTNLDIINFLKEHGVSVKEERGNRIFPTSDKSLDVLKAFETELKNKRVKIKFNTRVVGIETKENKVVSVMYEDENGGQKKILANKVILATGGKTYSATGSTGDGYEIAQKLGHTIVPVKPSLVPLTAEGESLNTCKEMQGLSLRNVQIKLIDTNKNKTIYEDFGEMLFTHFGVSGPTILSSSAHLLRYKNVENLLKEGKIQLVIDLKPALQQEKLDNRIQRDFLEGKNKEFKNCLNKTCQQIKLCV